MAIHDNKVSREAFYLCYKMLKAGVITDEEDTKLFEEIISMCNEFEDKMNGWMLRIKKNYEYNE